MINKLFNINNKLISRLSFIFLAYATIAGGHVAMLLPCEIQYSLENNKGYPTKEHKKAINEHGLSNIHRKSFKI